MSIESQRIETWEEELQAALSGGMPSFWNVRCYKSVGSTMVEARKLISEISLEQGGVVLAMQQTNGRGRQGRSWISAKEGFFGTFAFGCRGSFNPAGLTLAFSTAVREALLELGCQSACKWPNDIYSLDGRKLCGILVENLPAQGGRAILCGVGLNIAGEPPEVPSSVSFQTLCGHGLSPLDLAGRLGVKLRAVWSGFLQDGFASYREVWQKHALYRGRHVQIDTGRETIEGVFSGVSISGSAMLICRDGYREVSTGHVVSSLD